MAILGSLGIALTADAGGVLRGLSQAEAANQRYARRVSQIHRQLSGTIRGVTQSFIGLAAAFGGAQVLRSTDDLIKLSRATGLNFDEFQRLAFAFEQAGVANTNFTRGVVTLSQRILDLERGSGTVADAFERLGLAFDDLNGLSQREQLFLVLDRLRGIEDASVRAGTAAQIFGSRLSIALGPILAQTNDQITELGQSIQTITTSDAEGIEGFNDAVSNLGRALGRLLTTFSPLFGIIEALLNAVSRIADFFGPITQILGAVLVIAIGRAISSLLGLTSVFASGIAVWRQWNLQVNESIRTSALFDRVLARVQTTTITTAARLGFLGQASRAADISMRLLIRTTQGLSLALRLVGGPVGALFTAFTVLTTFFYDEFVIALRFVANQVIRFINVLIGVANRLGADINMLELYSYELDNLGESAQEVAGLLPDVADALGMVNEELMEGPMNATNSWQDFLDSSTDVLSQYETLAMDTFRGATDAIVDFFETGRLNLRDFVADFIRQFARIQISNALGLLLGGRGSFIAGRQFGGPVARNTPYIVGEAGPELFVPSSNGQIVPNNELGGGGVTNININAVDARSFQQLAASDPQFFANLANEGNRQLGVRR